METKIYELLMAELQKTTWTDDVPVSGLITDEQGKVELVAHNTRQKENKITGHAELTLINKIAQKNNSLKLNDYTMYVTLEPCAMCYSAAKQANITKIYYLVDNTKNDDTKLLTLHDSKIKIASFGTKRMKDNYRKIINNFFENRR